MKNYFIPILLLFAIIGACNPGGKELKGNLEDHLVLKPFSDSVLIDTFKVSMVGQELKDMTIRFSITAHNGQQIYQKDFAARDLIADYKSSVDLKKERSQMDFILNEYKQFLDDENFLEPAVTENENADQYTPDKTFYEELKQSSLNGFKYRTGKENNVYIAWSEKEKKVKPYYDCCK
ncbi:hypothetical protein [Pedobacter nyackensis]|uniref:hypothetical protein n=1 Tax=Pedobacter nyackensis TaxID=475255 RepID=UPI00293194EE|nr:hypothetical protein [Pedobacter nyackensis]